MSGTVAVVVVSFERPRMLREALASIGPCDQVILADDGSSFDVAALAAEFDLPNLTLVFGQRRTPEERMVTPSCGALINAALREVETDYVAAGFCDDDLLAPGWLRAAAAALDADLHLHMVRGEWGLFNDGEQLDPHKLCTFSFSPPLTAGCFVERMTCYTVEQCWWDTQSLAVHDGPMLSRYIAVHGGQGPRPPWLGYLDVLAGYRREHPKTVSNHSLFGGDRYLPDTAALFAVPGGME